MGPDDGGIREGTEKTGFPSQSVIEDCVVEDGDVPVGRLKDHVRLDDSSEQVDDDVGQVADSAHQVADRLAEDDDDE